METSRVFLFTRNIKNVAPTKRNRVPHLPIKLLDLEFESIEPFAKTKAVLISKHLPLQLQNPAQLSWGNFMNHLQRKSFSISRPAMANDPNRNPRPTLRSVQCPDLESCSTNCHGTDR